MRPHWWFPYRRAKPRSDRTKREEWWDDVEAALEEVAEQKRRASAKSLLRYRRAAAMLRMDGHEEASLTKDEEAVEV